MSPTWTARWVPGILRLTLTGRWPAGGGEMAFMRFDEEHPQYRVPHAPDQSDPREPQCWLQRAAAHRARDGQPLRMAEGTSRPAPEGRQDRARSIDPRPRRQAP